MSTTNELTSLVPHRFTEHDLFTSTMNEESPTPLSETVTTLASNVYKELERLIRHFGENSVKDLMPVMISILGQFFVESETSKNVCRSESLDGALHDRDVWKMENESLKEQNEQLFQQYEKEKSLHKEYQQVNSRRPVASSSGSGRCSVIPKSKIIWKKPNAKTTRNLPVSNRS